MAATFILQDIQIAPPGKGRIPDLKEPCLAISQGSTEPPVEVPLRFTQPTERSATPDSLLLGTLNHPRVRLVQPLRVDISREDGFIVAQVPELDEFGYGPHLTAAIDDLQQSLVELYLTLETDQDRLGPDLARLWVQLQRIIHAR